MSFGEEEIIRVVRKLSGFEEGEIVVERLFSGTNVVSVVKGQGGNAIFREFRAANLIDERKEREVFSLASKFGVGPKGLVVEQEFRVEEFIEGKTMNRRECGEFLKATAEALVKFHSIPVVCTENSILNYLVDWKAKAEMNLEKISLDERISGFLVSLNQEWNHVMELLLNDYQEFVLCHNDFSYGNLILTPTEVKVIDYDYSGTGHPSIDLASFCIETMFDFSQPIYQYLPHEELSQELQKTFVHTYADLRNLDPKVFWSQFQRSKAVVCYLGALWAGCQYSESNPSMLNYLEIRLSLFQKYKSELILL